MTGIDPLMTRLAEALRRTAQLTLEPNKYGGLLSEYHKAWDSAKEALAAYDERVASLAAPDPEPPTDPSILARLEALEATVARWLTTPAAQGERMGVAVTTPVSLPRPIVGRRVRSLGGEVTSLPLGKEAVIARRRETDSDGRDDAGYYWALRGGCWECIGKPGIDFEFID